MAKLTGYRVLTFDCYGTLIDWETGIWDALQPLIMRSGRSDVTRDAALLGFAKHEHRHQSSSPGLRYPKLLARVHRSMAESLGMPRARPSTKHSAKPCPCGRHSPTPPTPSASSSVTTSS